TRVEEGINLDADPTTLFGTGPLEPPSNIQVREVLFQTLTGVDAKADVSWSPSSDPRVELYEVQLMAQLDGSAWQSLAMTTTATARRLAQGLYSFRVRSTSQFWPPSEWVQLDYSFAGLFAPPGDVQNLWSNVLSETILLGWDPVLDLDLDHYEIRYQPRGQTP